MSLNNSIDTPHAYTAAGSVEAFPRWAISATNVTPSAGFVWLTRITLPVKAYTTMSISVGGTQGVTLTNTFLGLYDLAGNLLATSADISTALAAITTNSGVNSFTVNYTVTTEGDYYTALLIGSAVTLPTLQGHGGSQLLIAAAPALAARSVATGLTALPSTVVLSTSLAANYWVRMG